MERRSPDGGAQRRNPGQASRISLRSIRATVGAPMNFQERLSDICRRMQDEKLLLLVAFHDGAHFIEKPNPVTVLSGFKSIGPAAALLFPDGACNLIVTPRWDAERAAELCPQARVVGTDDLTAALHIFFGDGFPPEAHDQVGIAGLPFLPSGMARPISAALPRARAADKLMFDAARTKTTEEIGFITTVWRA